jgi:hypothetical protein
MLAANPREEPKSRRIRLRLLAAALIPAAAFILAVSVPEGLAMEELKKKTFDDSEVYFELNNTDEDLGIHALIDGDAWKRIRIKDPDGEKLLKVRIKGRLGKQGLTELFFESAEPNFDDLAPRKFFNRFPEGEYEIEGVTLGGQEIRSVAEVTHLMPAPPGNIMVSGVPAAEDCDVIPLPVVSAPVTIDWDPVTLSHPDLGDTNEPIEVDLYQVFVEEEASGLVFSLELPSDVTEVTIPEALIVSGGEYKLEILVREDSGNQTAVESCFEVE